MSTPFDRRQAPEPLAFGLAPDWNLRRRLTPGSTAMVGISFALIVIITVVTVAIGAWQGAVFFGLIAALALPSLLPRRYPLGDVLLRQPDAEERDLGIAFDRSPGRVQAASLLVVLLVVGPLLACLVVWGRFALGLMRPGVGGLIALTVFTVLLALLVRPVVRLAALRWSQPDSLDVVLTARGIRLGDHAALLPWDSITAFEPVVDHILTGRVTLSVPRIRVHARNVGAAPRPLGHVFDVAGCRQHPVAMLNILEHYRTHPADRVELGTQLSVLRCRRITAAVNPATLR